MKPARENQLLGTDSKERNIFNSYHHSINKIISLGFTFSHLGAWNSFSEAPICVCVRGEIQNPHSNQAGKEAAMKKVFLVSSNGVIYL